MRRIPFAQSNLIRADDDVANFIDSTPTGTAKHLENFVRSERMLYVIAPIRFSCKRNTAKREINPCGQPHRRDDHTKLTGFGQWLDYACASSVAQSAVMIRDSALEHFGQVLAYQLLLVETQRQRIWRRQVTSKFCRE